MSKHQNTKSNSDSLQRSKIIMRALYLMELRNNPLLKLGDILKAIDYMINFQNEQGPQQLMKLSKASRLMVLSYVANGRVTRDSSLWIKSDKLGLPTWLGKLKDPEVLNDPKTLRVVLTVLFITRWLNFKGEADLDLIKNTEPVSIDPEFKTWLRSDDNPLGFLTTIYTHDPVEYYSSTKAGPSGPSLMSSLQDLYSLPDDYREKLILLKDKFDPISEVSGLLKRELPDFKSLVTSKKSFRKIEIIDDKEGKKRIIAIPDYWTQCVMRSLHKSLNRVLDAIPADCTFNQENFKPLLSNFGIAPFSSIDLKSATELMPSNWQAEVLRWLSGDDELGDLWLSTLCDYPFDHASGPVLYRRGQPMGVYSSWPMMAITHHLLVQWAASRKGIDVTHKYALLGDDLLLIGDDLHEAYQEVVLKSHMILNQTKTFRSKRLCEFAKRFFLMGEEVSPFPLGAVLGANSDLSRLAVALDNAFAKSWLTRFVSEEDARIPFLKVLLESQKTPVPTRFWRQLEMTIGLTSIFRWVTGSTTCLAPSKLGSLFSSFPCNRNWSSLRNLYKGYFSFLLLNEANKKTFEYLQTHTRLTMHLMMSGIGTFPDILSNHPAMRLCVKFTEALAPFQNDVHRILREEGVESLNIKSLLDLAIQPVPSLQALYREDKQSVRRVAQLGKLSKDFLNLVELHHDKITLDYSNFGLRDRS